MKVLITQNGIIFDETELFSVIGAGGMRHLRSKLTITHQVRIGNRVTPAKIQCLYKSEQVGNRLLFIAARHSNPVGKIHKYLLKLKGGANRADSFIENLVYDNKIPAGLALSDRSDSGIDLFDHQKQIVSYLFKNIYTKTMREQGIAGCVLVVGTGQGKSYIGTWVAARLCGKTAFILPNTAQIGEWKQIFQTHYPHLRIGEYHSKTKTDGDFVLMVKNSAVADEFKFNDGTVLSWKAYTSQFRTVIYDEIHKYPTHAFSEMFWRFGCKYTLGLTATPDERSDPFSAIYKKHVGPLITMDDITDDEPTPEPTLEQTTDEHSNIDWKARVRVIRYHGPSEYTKKLTGANDWMHAGKMAQQFCSDPYRNRLILKLIQECYADGRNVFVFAENRKSLTQLRDWLIKAPNAPHNIECPEEDVHTMMGGITQDEKADASKKGKIILITYGFGSDQISIVKMDTIILATSRKAQMKQVIGRIFRLGGDYSKERLIIDIVDEETDIKKQHSVRRKVYAASEYNIKIGKDESIKYTDLQ